MCWAEKCCYFIPANIGCIMLGIISFILSTFLLVASATSYIILGAEKEGPLTSLHHFASYMGLELSISSVHMILGILIIVALLWMPFSVLLFLGILKNKPSMVLAYFSFGIIITIMCQLSALLLLLQNCWIPAIILFISSLIHIHYLVVVHTVYELMLKGRDFRFGQHRDDDEDHLAECFDGDTEIN